MRNFRSLIDITPWDKNGYSFWGLNRDQAKKLGLFFIIIGVALADPPFSILPTDFINLWVGGIISNVLNISFELGILLSYTVLAWGFIFLGVWIYPYDSRRLLSGYINKFKRLLAKAIHQPIILGAGLVIFYFIFQWYKSVINAPVDASQEIFSGLQNLVIEPTELTILFVVGIIIFILIMKNKGDTR